MISILVPVLVIVISVLDASRLGNQLPWRDALHLYRSAFLIIIEIIFVSINVYGWSSSGVNHILIFEIDPRHHLTYQQLLEIGLGLVVCWLISFIAFVIMSHLDFYPFTQPLIFLVLLILFFVNPIPIFYRPARYWLFKILYRIFSAAFHPILFAEFWLADQLTSLELAFFDFQYFFCFFISDSQFWSNGLRSTASFKGAFCMGWTQYLLQGALLALPSLLRLVQCIRRYHDSKHDSVHMANAGKYLTTVIVAITNSARRATALNYPGNPKRNPLLYVWILAAFVSATYKLIWDLKMDWGFFDKKAGKNKYLREQTVYSRKSYYYGVIVEDIIFRYIWIINIFVEFSSGTAEYSDFIGFAFGLVEIFRRFLWNFFRLENEHLNNCGKFRAIRDISIGPIATGINFKLLNNKLKKEPGIQGRRNRMSYEIGDEEENVSTTDDITIADVKNNTAHFRRDSTAIFRATSVSEVNEINTLLQNIASNRRHTLMLSADDPNIFLSNIASKRRHTVMPSADDPSTLLPSIASNRRHTRMSTADDPSTLVQNIASKRRNTLMPSADDPNTLLPNIASKKRHTRVSTADDPSTLVQNIASKRRNTLLPSADDPSTILPNIASNRDDTQMSSADDPNTLLQNIAPTRRNILLPPADDPSTLLPNIGSNRDDTQMSSVDDPNTLLQNIAPTRRNTLLPSADDPNTLLPNIASNRDDTQMPSTDDPNISYPILRFGHPNKSLEPAKSL